MELTQQRSFPHIINILLGIFVFRILESRSSGQKLNIAKQELSPTIIALVIRLGGVCPTVKLKV